MENHNDIHGQIHGNYDPAGDKIAEVVGPGHVLLSSAVINAMRESHKGDGEPLDYRGSHVLDQLVADPDEHYWQDRVLAERNKNVHPAHEHSFHTAA